MTNRNSLIIGIDADGVLLNYNLGFGKVWEKTFGAPLTIKSEKAYHATTFWGVDAPARDHKFWQVFDKEGWRFMEAMPGALLACQKLKAAGHRLVCITSMPSHKREDRLKNLQDLGFPIDDVLAVGHSRIKGANPKKEALDKLAPDIFIDDELRKLKNLSCACVLIAPDNCPDSPNEGQDDSFISHRVRSLLEFAEYLTSEPSTKKSPSI